MLFNQFQGVFPAPITGRRAARPPHRPPAWPAPRLSRTIGSLSSPPQSRRRMNVSRKDLVNWFGQSVEHLNLLESLSISIEKVGTAGRRSRTGVSRNDRSSDCHHGSRHLSTCVVFLLGGAKMRGKSHGITRSRLVRPFLSIMLCLATMLTLSATFHFISSSSH